MSGVGWNDFDRL
ncbi:hypothetical protein VCR12J2_620805 [Vibrio coralliirubri]|nr:hypothetical protein VCR29J2_1000065 [Vibrio coralliirubri]CDU02447.1 hypothetical protein VCR12J2_620805 [Vibrio coralliirubri]